MSRAERAFRAGDFDGAGALYLDAYETLRGANLAASAAILFNAGLAFEKSGACDRAAETFARFLDAAPDSGKFPDFVARLAKARECAPELTIETVPPGASVQIDGAPAPGKTPLRVRVKHGSRAITVSADGFAPVEARIAIVPGKAERLSRALVPLPHAAPPAAPPAPAAAAPTRPSVVEAPAIPEAESSGPSAWVWVSSGTALAAFATASIFFALDQSAFSDVEAEAAKPTHERDSALARSRYDDARAYAIGGWIGIGTGAALLSLAGLLLLEAD